MIAQRNANWDFTGQCGREVPDAWRAYTLVWSQGGDPDACYFGCELRREGALTEWKEDGSRESGFQIKGTACAEALVCEGQGQRVGSAVCRGIRWGLGLVRWARARHSEPLGLAKTSKLGFQNNDHPLKGLAWIRVRSWVIVRITSPYFKEHQAITWTCCWGEHEDRLGRRTWQ